MRAPCCRTKLSRQRWKAAAAAGVAWLTAAAIAGGAAPSSAAEPLRLKIVGGIGGVKQYSQLEEPFWSKSVSELTGGRVEATIYPFDRSGFRGQEMLQLMRLGVVPFGTAIVASVSGEEPEVDVVDLPTLNPDFASLEKTVGLYRSHLASVLRDTWNTELLAVYAHPSQVVFCAKPFSALKDLAGRRVRTSSVGQSEMMRAIGAVPVIVPFNEIVGAVSTGVVDCAITGTLSGNEVGLPGVTTHIHSMAINWGLSLFGANVAAWNALPDDIREKLRTGLADLERRVWETANRDTAGGIACNVGAPSCTGRRGQMTLVPVTATDEALRRKLLVETVLPAWVQRCGTACAKAWNGAVGSALGLHVESE